MDAVTEEIIEKELKDNDNGLSSVPSANDAVAMDVFRNLAARIGFSTPSVAEDTDYYLARWSNNYWLMITLYRNHWISRRIVDKPAQDMCKAWPTINSDGLTPDDLGKFDRTLRKTFTQQRIQTAIKWARLFGGAGALIVIDGHEDILEEPLDLETITPGSYKGLLTFDRWSGISPTEEVSTDINRPQDFNLPEYYQVTGESGKTFRVHSSRILRFCGPEVPRPENQAQMHWGISVLEPAFEDIRKRDNASWTILNLMFRANILGKRDPELSQLLSGLGASGAAAEKFATVLEAQNQLLSNQSMVIVGKDGEMFQNSYSFAGISEVYQQFQMDVAGSAKIPVTILFGRTATGLGQSNDADIRIYEQEIAQSQIDELRPQLDKLYPVIMMSEFGEVPDDLDMTFPSIRVLTEEEKGKIASDNTEAVLAPYNVGLVGPKYVLQELKAQADVTGIGTNITEKMINEADDQPNAMMSGEFEMAQAENEGNEEEESSTKKPAKKKKGKAKDNLPLQEYRVNGLPIMIETRAGQKRQGKDFEVTMPADYGFIKGTLGADGDEMDCYVGNEHLSDNVFVIHQNTLDGQAFDEHKCMIGYENIGDAIADYYRGHHRAHEVFAKIEPMTMDQFKGWLVPKASNSIVDKIANFVNMHRIS